MPEGYLTERIIWSLARYLYNSEMKPETRFLCCEPNNAKVGDIESMKLIPVIKVAYFMFSL